MVFEILYPRAVRAWMKKARQEVDHDGPLIEDLVLPAYLEPIAKSKFTELGRLFREHRDYKLRWYEMIVKHTRDFERLLSPSLTVFEKMRTLHKLATISHRSSVMESLKTASFYQTAEGLSEQLKQLVEEVTERANNGSEEDFKLLRHFLMETSSLWPYPYYPDNYPELVDQFVENPTYEDYLVRSIGPLEQARYSNSLNFLRLFIEESGGSAKEAGVSRMFGPADDLKLYILYDIEARIKKLSKGESPN